MGAGSRDGISKGPVGRVMVLAFIVFFIGLVLTLSSDSSDLSNPLTPLICGSALALFVMWAI